MMSREEALVGKEIPEEIKKQMTLIDVHYLSFDGEIRDGQLVVHREVFTEVQELFQRLLETKFPIQRIVPVVVYGWNDAVSMATNNTSAFNYRVISGTNRLSNHSYGRAIDINPVQNPCVQKNGSTVPSGARYDVAVPGTITEDIAALFISRGWIWGGNWTEPKDWQHFEKPVGK